MKNFGAKWLALAAVSAAIAGMSVNGCGGGDDGTGTAGKGGTTGGAGKGGTTGSAGTGGSTSTAGTGGSTSTAGTTGTAGKGGTTGTAGTSGGGTGGGTGLLCPQGTFDTALEGFALNSYMDSTPGAAINLAVREGGTPATLSLDAADGNPANGSLKIDAPFTGYNQYVDVQHNLGTGMIKNWSGLKLHVKAKVVGGNPSPMNPMGVQPYVNTGATYNGYCGKYVNLITGGGWNDYVLDLSACSTTSSNTSMVIAYGVSFQAGSGSDGDGGVNTMVPATATIHVDSFWLEGSATCVGGGTAGTGGAAGGTTGTGGATGGTTGTGGATAGTTGTGGATAGTTGTGGATAGTTGTGGATAGTTGTGGATAGTTGTGGAATLTVSNFDTTVDSFGLNNFMSSSAGADINLAVREAGTMASIAWDGTQGVGTPVGSIKVSAPFDSYKQFFDLTRNFGATLQDWTGKTTMKVRFKVTAGGNPDPAFPAGAQAYVQTTTGYVGIFGYNNVASGTDWQIATVALNPATPPTGWNLAQVQQVGLKITSGNGTGADAAVASGPPTAATIYVDSVWAE